MRILHVGKHYPPVCGGMERIVGALCEGLAERGHTVAALVSNEENAISKEILRGVSVTRLPSHGKILSQPLTFGWMDEIVAFDPDIVHVHLPNPLALWQLARWQGPKCFTLHARPGGLRGSLDRLLTLNKNLDSTIFSSTEEQNAWRERGLTTNSRVIQFGLRPPKELVTTERKRATLLTVGRLARYKGLESLVRAVRGLDVELLIVGEGPLRETLEKIAPPNVNLLGRLDDQAVSRLYLDCTMYIQASNSTSEAFGLSVLEAMHHGCAIVSTALPTGVRNLNQHERTGLVVPPDDERALRAAIETLLQDPARRREMGASSTLHARLFDFDLMVEKHLDLYRSLALQPHDFPTAEANSGP